MAYARRALSRRRQALQAGRPRDHYETVVAPIGGWNARDSLATLRAEDALELINWFPQQTDCVLRPGSQLLCDTATGQPVRSLIPYEYGTTSKVLAGCAGKLFEVSSGSPSTLGSSFASDYWHGDALQDRVILVNGVDTPQLYNGSALSNAAYTMNAATPIVGFDQKNFSYVMSFKSHVYFIEKNTQRVWYTDTNAFNGEVTLFDLSLTGRIAGNLMMLATLSKDGGAGQNDLWIAITTAGQVVVYQGSNPEASDWSRVGTIQIGRPLSSYGLVATGADIMVLTDRGYENFLRSYQDGEALRSADLASDKIQNAVSISIDAVGANENWRAMLWSGGHMLIVTVPTTDLTRNYIVREDGTYILREDGISKVLAETDSQDNRHMHVRNTNTGAWCKFTDLSALSWAKMQGTPIFGSALGKIYELSFSHTTDDDVDITTTAQLSWNYLGPRGYKKILHAIKLAFTTASMPTVRLQIAPDFGQFPTSTLLDVGQQGALAQWDTAQWDVSAWSTGRITREFWHGQGAVGRNFGVLMTTSSHLASISWNTVSFLHEMGGVN